MPAILALALIALAAVAVLTAAVHVLFPPGCWWPPPSWPGSSSGRVAPISNPAAHLPPPGPRWARLRAEPAGQSASPDNADRDVKTAPEPPFCIIRYRHG
jgi:hypothetical protein